MKMYVKNCFIIFCLLACAVAIVTARSWLPVWDKVDSHTRLELAVSVTLVISFIVLVKHGFKNTKSKNSNKSE